MTQGTFILKTTNYIYNKFKDITPSFFFEGRTKSHTCIHIYYLYVKHYSNINHNKIIIVPLLSTIP